MKIISIPKKQYEKLKGLDLPREVFNTEGQIYDFKYKRERKVLKELFMANGESFANKLFTIEMLDTYSEYLPENFYIPDYLVSVNKEIVGFTVPFVEGINLSTILKDKHQNYQDQLYYLKSIGKTLDELQKIRKYTQLKTFFINDLHDSNFIVNPLTKQIYSIDLDSCRIGNNVAFPSRFLTPLALLNNVNGKYKINKKEIGPGYIIADENTDLYCYIIIILNYLLGKNINNFQLEEFYEYLNYLEKIGVNTELLDIFSKIVNNVPNENPYQYLESLTESQIFRAKEHIYKLTKGNL